MADRQYELVYILPPDTTEAQVTELHRADRGRRVAACTGRSRKPRTGAASSSPTRSVTTKEGVYVLDVINGSGELMKELDRRLQGDGPW